MSQNGGPRGSHWRNYKMVCEVSDQLAGRITSMRFGRRGTRPTSVFALPWPIWRLPPCATIGAFALGFLITRKRPDPVGQFVFLPGALLVAPGIYESTTSWSFPATMPARIQFLFVNAFGVKPGCEGDCFGAVGALVLLPSLAYSIGAFFAIRRRGAQARPT
jgi:hypothetical protein